jgi:hypothetical protein
MLNICSYSQNVSSYCVSGFMLLKLSEFSQTFIEVVMQVLVQPLCCYLVMVTM